ncbi:MAG: ATPase, T2SS/T4P/T4SS family [archaeon]
MMFKSGTPMYSYEVVRESGENVMYINYLGANFVPSLIDSAEVMGRTIDNLKEDPNIARIVFVQQRNYSHDFSQVEMLVEIANLSDFLIKQEKIVSVEKLSHLESSYYEAYAFFNHIINELLSTDPVKAYRELKGMLFSKRALLERDKNLQKYVRIIEKVVGLFDELMIIKKLKDSFDSYGVDDREIYSEVFRADIMPNFTFTRMIARIPEDAEIVKQYSIAEGSDKSLVSIFRRPNKAKLVYHLSPPEYLLDEDHHMLLNLARNVLIEHRPTSEEFNDPERTRQIFFNVARDLLSDLAGSRNINLSYGELKKLANILVRHTIGFGVLEVLLQDESLQDIMVNAPVSLSPIFVKHNDFDECVTNLIPSQEDADSWAAKFRMTSGRALDEANPILDTNLEMGGVSSRVAIIQQPLSAGGLAYALRRHRTKPWTLPLFIKNKMIDSLGAGLLSFMIDGARTMLVAGTRSSGKTSLLGALLLEIMPSHRVITVEDSVSGDASILIWRKGVYEKISIGSLVDMQIDKYGFVDADGREKAFNLEGIKVFSFNRDGRVALSKPSKFIRHKNTKDVYEVETISGKKIKVTKDHSLFSLDVDNLIRTIKPTYLKEKDFIAIPRKLNFGNEREFIDVLSFLGDVEKRVYVLGKPINNYLDKNRKELFDLCYRLNYKKATIQSWTINKILPYAVYIKLKKQIGDGEFFIKSYSSSKIIPARIKLNENFLNFLGLWLADGCYDKKSVLISVQEEENREVVCNVAKELGVNVKMHSDKFSFMLNSGLFRNVMEKILLFRGNSYTKTIPSWIYGLSNRQVGWLLKGFYSGDGCVSDKEVVFSSCSSELVKDVSTLLLRFGIILRYSSIKRKDKCINCRIGDNDMIKLYRKHVGFLVNKKKERLEKLCSRKSSHNTTDLIPLDLITKKKLRKELGGIFSSQDYITRNNNLGIRKLKSLIGGLAKGGLKDKLTNLVNCDLYWDKVRSVKKVNYKGYVYDISVPGDENFICENILAHNTLELPVSAMRKLDYDILSMKVRSALMGESTEVSAEEGIRASLRLGDSSLIVGEIRSAEAKALYEAMRVGALANVVAGTIHGGSPYSVFDRVVNDLGVPITSFKATDLIVVANPIKSADGLHSWRRVLQIAEVRKHWTKDPLTEGGFVDLMKYDVKDDIMKPSDDLMNGDSEIMKEIASNVKGWAGNWDAVWDNVVLRQKIKQETVDFAERMKMPELLEAEFTVKSNNAFHQISDKVTKEIGLPTSEAVFPKWRRWLEKESKKLQL